MGTWNQPWRKHHAAPLHVHSAITRSGLLRMLQLPKEVEELPSLEIFQSHLDVVLGTGLWVVPAWAGVGAASAVL